MTTAYAPDKAIYWLDRLQAIREGRVAAPVHVLLIPSDLCNQDCPQCIHRVSGYTLEQRFPDADGKRNPNRMIPTEKCLEIIRDCCRMGVEAIQILGGGEPSIHPGFDIICRDVVRNGMKLALVSNGVALTPETCDMLRRKASWIRISFEAATAETYAKCRRAPEWHFEKACENVKRLAQHPRKTRLGVGFVIMPENAHEVEAFVALGASLGVDNVRFKSDITRGADLFTPEQRAEITAAINRSRNLGVAVVDNFTIGSRDLDTGRPDYSFCGYQHFTTYIGGDLTVYRCCTTSYNDIGAIGSLKDQTFRQLWEGESVQRGFREFDARSCTFCMFNDKNRSIAGAITPRDDVEFV